ncbi:Hypothetical protein R9X50_00672800 [Acrodontium crateriforme]|uniref:DUF7923 domain-containing protein n=1 Tax=Acrodontium crateriforme TaxID=150365 RepID=A0AAQ3MA62_9PEZI|nr:Hypothetical protein R9X50_00672800 [Acrodontium crateriforme]
MADEMAERMAKYRSHDDERHKFIEEMFQTHQKTIKKLSEVTRDYEMMMDTFRLQADLVKSLEARLKSVQKASFVLVLLDADADGYFFDNPLIANGHDGGIEAANKLRRAIGDKLVSQQPDLEDLPIMIKAYIYLEGARSAFERANLDYLASQLPEFITGFNQVELCDFVCVGSGKDRADEKIRGVFELFLANPTCMHIAFAACHDNGYSRVLEKIDDDAVKKKITLIESFYTGKEFEKLGIRKAKVKGIFRSTLLQSPQKQTAALARKSQNAEVLQSGAQISYSSVAGGSGVSLPKSIGNGEFTAVPINGANGSNVDARKSLDKKIKDGYRFCIAHLLRRECKEPATCPYSHGAELSREELILWKEDMVKGKPGNGFVSKQVR